VKKRRKKWKAVCGTQTGLAQHLRTGERPCGRCLIGSDTYKDEEIQALIADFRRQINAQHLWKTYQLSTDRFDQIFDEQDRRCGCCQTMDPGEGSWNVDHDHQTDKIRGILCSSCNQGIGFLGDNLEGLHRAVAYLKAHQARGGHKKTGSAPSNQFAKPKISALMQRCFEFFKQGVPRDRVVVILRLTPGAVDELHALWRNSDGEVVQIKRHFFQIAKDRPQCVTCACGFSATWNESGEMEATIERVNAHISNANADRESEWRTLKAEEDAKRLQRRLEEKQREFEEEERRKEAKRLKAIDDMRGRQIMEQKRREEEQKKVKTQRVLTTRRPRDSS
jgi:hypothetical protein